MILGLVWLASAVTPIQFQYHHYDEATDLLKSFVEKYPNFCQLYSIGQSVQKRYVALELYNERLILHYLFSAEHFT